MNCVETAGLHAFARVCMMASVVNLNLRDAVWPDDMLRFFYVGLFCVAVRL